MPQIFSTGGLATGEGGSKGLLSSGFGGETEGLEGEGLTLTRLAIWESRLVPEGTGFSWIVGEARMGV